jgi:nicotinate phosphoribosyltransferase
MDNGQPVEMIIDPTDELRRKVLPKGQYQLLLQPLARQGSVVWPQVSVLDAQAYCQASLAKLDASSRRFLNPHRYPVGLEPSLHSLRDKLRRKAKGLE